MTRSAKHYTRTPRANKYDCTRWSDPFAGPFRRQWRQRLGNALLWFLSILMLLGIVYSPYLWETLK